MTFTPFTGKQYLQIDIANSFGLEKKKWNERLAWFAENEHQLLDLVSKAKEPALFYAATKAWEDTKVSRPSGYPISLDATSSGIQILSLLTGDRRAAMLCNVLDTGSRENAYQVVYDAWAKLVGKTTNIDMDAVKKAIMTAFYSSKATPKRVFGEGELLEKFYETLGTLCPGAWELNEAMLEMWDATKDTYKWIMPDDFHVNIKVMAPVRYEFEFMGQMQETTVQEHRPMESGRSLGANMVHSIDGMIVREMVRRCAYNAAQIEKVTMLCRGRDRHIGREMDATNKDTIAVMKIWDHYLESGFLSAVILDHITRDNVQLVDAAVVLELIESLPKKSFKVLTIHDCFRCLPNYGNDLRMQYNTILANIGRSNMLSYLLTQITGEAIFVEKIDPDMWKEVYDTNYALS